MTIEELEAKVKYLEDKIRSLEDIDQIKELQRIYGYYLDNRMYDEAIDLFSEDTESFEISSVGVFKGKEGARKFLTNMKNNALKKPEWARGLSLHMQLQGVVHLNPTGITARGRWQCWMCLNQTFGKELRAIWGLGVFENDYIKENGKWLFKRLRVNIRFMSPYEDGWLKTPFINASGQSQADIPAIGDMTYPSGYDIPLHYKHPITGK
ncbi:MAG: hypothetical protein A2144_14215 [Chloroflexi bacterium RBG_16_50_9]|nr:MAG: hypothetical protein A2144_14215 [Chloroflexi bacterium RBG_16_50_9]